MQLSHVLKHIREQRGFAVNDAAATIGAKPERLSAFESGEAEPTWRQLEKMAQAYGVPSYVFAAKTLPNLEESLADFRRSEPGPAHLSPRGMRKIWNGEKISRFTRQLLNEIDVQLLDLPNLSSSSPEIAAEFRDYFDEWLGSRRFDLELTGGKDDVFFVGLRIFLESRGIIVNVNDAPAADYKGYYISPEAGEPVAFVNREVSSRKAQIFTLAHELCHHILAAEGISDPFVARNATERRCNSFAAEFVAPLSRFRKVVEKFPKKAFSEPLELINLISSRSLLSRQATAIRLSEAGYIGRIELRAVMRVLSRGARAEKLEERSELPGGVPHAKRLSELGYLPVYVASRGVANKIIDEIDVESGIGLSESLQDKAFDLAGRRLEVALKS